MENCQHKNGTKPDWTYSTCKDCGAVLTDGSWGIASRKWFRDLAEAKFYKEHGRFSDGEELAQLIIANKELLTRCDLLEVEKQALRAALQKIADGRGMIPDKSTIYMNGKVPEAPKIFNKYDMQEIALAALVGEERW